MSASCCRVSVNFTVFFKLWLETHFGRFTKFMKTQMLFTKAFTTDECDPNNTLDKKKQYVYSWNIDLYA